MQTPLLDGVDSCSVVNGPDSSGPMKIRVTEEAENKGIRTCVSQEFELQCKSFVHLRLEILLRQNLGFYLLVSE